MRLEVIDVAYSFLPKNIPEFFLNVSVDVVFRHARIPFHWSGSVFIKERVAVWGYPLLNC